MVSVLFLVPLWSADTASSVNDILSVHKEVVGSPLVLYPQPKHIHSPESNPLSTLTLITDEVKQHTLLTARLSKI